SRRRSAPTRRRGPTSSASRRRTATSAWPTWTPRGIGRKSSSGASPASSRRPRPASSSATGSRRTTESASAARRPSRRPTGRSCAASERTYPAPPFGLISNSTRRTSSGKSIAAFTGSPPSPTWKCGCGRNLQRHRLPARRAPHVAVARLGERTGEGGLAVLVAVHEEDGLETLPVQPADEVEQARLVGVGGEVVEDGHLGAEPVRLAEDRDLLAPLHDPPPERVLGHEAHDHHRVSRVLDSVAEVVEDAPGLGHPARREDHHRHAHPVQLLRPARLADVLQPLEAEGVVVGEHVVEELAVVALRVRLEDAGDVDGEGAVHEDGDAGDAVLVPELVERVDELLRAADGEGGDDDLPAPR